MINKVTLSDGTTEIPGIIYGTFHYRAQCGAKGAFRYGGVFGSYIEFDYFKPTTVTVAKGDVIKYYQTVDVDNAFNSTTPRDCYVNDFIVQEVGDGKNSYHVVAYDSTVKLNVDFSKRLKELENSFPMSVYDIVNEAATVAGVTTNMQPVGQIQLYMSQNLHYFYADGITVRDIFSYAAEIFGGACHCGSSNYIFANDLHNISQAAGWLGANNYIIAPDSSDYHSGLNYRYNAWYKENGLEQFTAPSAYDGARIVSTNGTILGEYNSVPSPQNYYYVTGNLLIENYEPFTAQASYSDLAYIIWYKVSYIWNGSISFVPPRVRIFPFRMPFKVGTIAYLVDTQGTKTKFPIMSIDLSESEVLLESYGYDYEETDYGSSYDSVSEQQTLLSSEINQLFSSVDNIVNTMPQPSDSAPEDLGTADSGTSDEYSRADHVHNMPSIPSASSATPADLGTADAGTSDDFARADHVHNLPSGLIPSGMGFEFKTFSSGTSTTFTLGKPSRGFIFVTGFNTTMHDIIVYGVNSSGTVSYSRVVNASALTVTTASGSITLANGSSSIATAFKMST